MASGRRRHLISWFVEPYRQIKLGLMFLIVNFAFSFSILGVFGYYFYDVYSAMKVYFNLSSEQADQVLVKLTFPMYAAFFLIAAFVIVTLLVSVRYTYAIYGPLVSIHRFLDDVLMGRVVKPLILRESDQLQDLAQKLNLLAERLGDQRKAPMVAVYKFLDDLIKGDNPAPLKLRESDSLSEMVEKLNKVAEVLKARR
jgi:hypothetical protein